MQAIAVPSARASSAPSNGTNASSVVSAETRPVHAPKCRLVLLQAVATLVLITSFSTDDLFHDKEAKNKELIKSNLSLIEDDVPFDDFEVVIDTALALSPGRDLVIVDWDVLHSFWKVRWCLRSSSTVTDETAVVRPYLQHSQ